MRRFKKRADISVAFIPGYGRVGPNAVLEGDQWAKFCPALLVEVAAGAEAPKPAPVTATPPAPEVIAPPAPEPVPASASAPTPAVAVDAPKMSAAAEAGFPSPEELQAVVEAENASTEAQIAKVVDSLGAEEEKEPVKPVEPKKVVPKPKAPSKGGPRGRK